MRRSTFLLVSLISLALTACATVLSVMPVGDEPVYLEPAHWEGLWITGSGEPDEPQKGNPHGQCCRCGRGDP